MTVDVTTRSLISGTGIGVTAATASAAPVNSGGTTTNLGRIVANSSGSTNGTSTAVGGIGGVSGGGSSSSLSLQKQISFKNNNNNLQILKADEIEVIESGNANNQTRPQKNSTIGWICCAPCIWLRTSATVRKIALTAATLLVTSLLVASPILFLITTAPSQLPRDCYSEDEDCQPTTAPPPECTDAVCRLAALSIQAKMNWKLDPCKDFKEFSCSSSEVASTLRVARSAQEAVDIQMQQLLQHNTTTGPFRKLGRLYGSCLRQTTNSSTIQLVLEKLGGYLPIGALGPSSISSLISKIYELGPTPLFDIYYDLSYGKRPHVLLIIGGPGTSAPILENKIRWAGPKAPSYRIKETVPKLLNDLMDSFLPNGLTYDQKLAEKEAITTFIEQINKVRVQNTRRGFWDSSVLYNTSSLHQIYPFMNWTQLIPCNWTGPIVVRSPEYFRHLEELLQKYPTRVIHNSMLLLFALGVLPQGYPDPAVCTRATMWALPEISSSLFIAQHSSDDLNEVIKRTEVIFDSLKAHLKRAPSLKGAALVKLSALQIQAKPWPGFMNLTSMIKQLESIEITSDNWFENVLKIYKRNKIFVDDDSLWELDSNDAWAYPIVAKIFYDTLSHSIVVPLSVILVPYFEQKLPPYIQYASLGVSIAKEILRSITKNFEEKAMRCVPQSVNIFSNYSRMDILIQSGGMQISYHSLLSLSGPIKGMARLPGLNLTPTQIFFLVSSQELCAESIYSGIDTKSEDFRNIMGWLIAQGGSATEVFKCSTGSMINSQKTCNVL